ncbi:MAG: alkaline shock response membrane anchor protein AmaP [Clostridia bacterium]
MNILFRILLAVYAFFVAVISVFVCLIAISPTIFNGMSENILGDLTSTFQSRILLFDVAFVLLILSVLFLLSGIKSNKDRKAISKFSNIGEIKISLTSIENIALAAAKRLNGVKESKAVVNKTNEGVSIVIKTLIVSDMNIPELSEDIQAKVKSLVEQTTGIKVNEVKVIVENIHTGFKTRVE